jgi:hypothetical protein
VLLDSLEECTRRDDRRKAKSGTVKVRKGE